MNRMQTFWILVLVLCVAAAAGMLGALIFLYILHPNTKLLHSVLSNTVVVLACIWALMSQVKEYARDAKGG